MRKNQLKIDLNFTIKDMGAVFIENNYQVD